MLLAELGLLPLQVLWWQQTLRFWNSLAALPVGSFYYTVCLDNLTDAFQGGCLQYGQLCGGLLAFSGLLYATCVWCDALAGYWRYCHLPVSGGPMQRFVQFRLGCHSLPIAAPKLLETMHVESCRNGSMNFPHKLIRCHRYSTEILRRLLRLHHLSKSSRLLEPSGHEQRNLIASEGLEGHSAVVWWHSFCDDRKPACQEVNVLHVNDLESLTGETEDGQGPAGAKVGGADGNDGDGAGIGDNDVVKLEQLTTEGEWEHGRWRRGRGGGDGADGDGGSGDRDLAM
ncbi:TPA: hypothetical protein ACH3X1_005125 [Trebouxia sp. C0004]